MIFVLPPSLTSIYGGYYFEFAEDTIPELQEYKKLYPDYYVLIDAPWSVFPLIEYHSGEGDAFYGWMRVKPHFLSNDLEWITFSCVPGKGSDIFYKNDEVLKVLQSGGCP